MLLFNEVEFSNLNALILVNNFNLYNFAVFIARMQ